MGGGKDKDKNGDEQEKGLFGHGFGHGASGYPPQPGAYPPQGYPPQGYPPQGYPPQGYPPAGYPPAGYPPGAYPPSGYPPGPSAPHQPGILFISSIFAIV